MRQPKTARALGAALTTLGAFAALPALAQDATPAPPTPPATTPNVPAAGPGPAQQPAPPPGTTLPAPTQPAPPTPGTTTPTPPPDYGIQTSGLIDGYYLYQFTNPKGNSVLPNRFYDIRSDSPALALAELNVYMNPRPNSFGFKATLITGDSADLNHFGGVGVGADGSYTFSTAGTGGEGRFKNVQQLYGTYNFGGTPAGVDFGKFYTPFGYEVTESNGDYNYSRSLAYNFLPVYHTGFRIYTPVPGVSGLTATFYFVNALFNTSSAGVQDDNKQPAYIGQLNYADPKGRFTIVSELGLSKDKNGVDASGTIVNTKNVLNDNNFTYNFSSTVLAGLDYDYYRSEPNGGNKSTFNGYAVYFRQQFTPKAAYALRISGQSDTFENNATGGGNSPNARPYEFTATYDYKATTNFETKLEYRHDNANGRGIMVYPNGDDVPTRSNQDTVSVSGVFTF